MYVFVSTGKFPVSTGNFPVSTLVGVFVGILWCVLHRKNLSLRGHFRGHLRVHSRGHFREHFRESERPRSLLLSLGGAIQTLAWVLSRARPGPIPSPRCSRPDSPCALFYSVSDPSRSRGGGHPGPSWSHPAPERSLQDRAWTGRNRLLGHFRPDPNTSAKVSRCKWEPYRNTNQWCIYYILPRGGHTLAKVCHRNGRRIAILFKSVGVRGRFDSPEFC